MTVRREGVLELQPALRLRLAAVGVRVDPCVRRNEATRVVSEIVST